MALKILVSAGEASGDLYAATLVERLRAAIPEETYFFGCAGPRMQRAGVKPVVDASSLAVVGLIEVVSHVPRIWGEFRKLIAAAEREGPDLAILTDSPDFNLRVAARLKRLGVPVLYLVAPQVWAWRKGRLPKMRRIIDHLLCIFPFEEEFFTNNGIRTTYIGHPLARLVRPSGPREEFFRKHGLEPGRRLIALLPGSRHGEARRHFPAVFEAARLLAQKHDLQFALGLPAGRFVQVPQLTDFRERNPGVSIQLVEGETWDLLAAADVALAASGTVAVEAALLGTPMVTFYKVTALSWFAGKFLVDVPFYTMVNLVAGRRVVPEVMQNEVSGERLAAEAARLLDDEPARRAMRCDLEAVAIRLATAGDPMDRAAGIIQDFLRTKSKQ